MTQNQAQNRIRNQIIGKIPGKSQNIVEIAKRLGASGEISVPARLWGYGEIRYDEEKCIGCGKCEGNCSKSAIKFIQEFDLKKIFEKDFEREILQNRGESKKKRILNLIKDIAVKTPKDPVWVPELVEGYGRVVIDRDKCIGCGNCERNCSGDALHVEKILGL